MTITLAQTPRRSFDKARLLSRINAGSLKAALVLAGLNTAFTGLNRALGGIATLGWQGATDFLAVVDQHQYLIQDNHSRFLGGVWAGVGVLLLVASFDLKRFQPYLVFAFAMIFAGGLARFSTPVPDVLFGPAIMPSLIAELVGIPVLYYWLKRVNAGAS